MYYYKASVKTSMVQLKFEPNSLFFLGKNQKENFGQRKKTKLHARKKKKNFQSEKIQERERVCVVVAVVVVDVGREKRVCEFLRRRRLWSASSVVWCEAFFSFRSESGARVAVKVILLSVHSTRYFENSIYTRSFRLSFKKNVKIQKMLKL